MMRKNNAGFTLVELIVSIAASVLVIGAALSFMLLGLRMEKAASDDAAVQSDSRIIMRVLENIAAEGEIGEINFNENGEWQLYTPDDEQMVNPILSFDYETGTINGKDNVIIIDGIAASKLSYKNNVLSCDIETTSGDKYTSSVYCRVGVGKLTLAEIELDEEKIEEIVVDGVSIEEEKPARRHFLETLFSQYGSTGEVSDETVFNGYEFATWYWAINLQNNSDIWVNSPEKVPWCAIFVSWALNKTVNTFVPENGPINGKIPQNLDALVDNVMWYQFRRTPGSELAVDKGANNDKFAPDGEKRDEYQNRIDNEAYAQLGTWYYPEQEIGDGEDKTKFAPNPGDIVFFENDASNDRADHLGVFLYIEDGVLYTVEGNNNDRVGIFAYPYDEKEGVYTDGVSDVIGYGAINWAELGLVEEATADNEMSQ